MHHQCGVAALLAQVSPRYVSGFALRFARVKRYRTDKTAAEADTFETVQRLAGALV
jgi:DNA ligase-1